MAKKSKGDKRKSGQARKWINFLFGRRLASGEDQKEMVGPFEGIPVLGLDALASAAYGPEAALTLLIPIGLLGPREVGPISIVIVVVLTLVAFSYRQTIAAYPNGGGSYTVAKENLGERWGLLAGAALTVDYILNVAVAISAGVAAIGSAFPPLLPYTLPCCLGLLALLTLINLRGVREAGLAFMLPTYIFTACLLTALAIGVGKAMLAHGHPLPVTAPPHLPPAKQAITFWLLLRAFANGCTAMTGVEAVSNAVPIFREPKVKHAQLTLMIIIGILVLMLLGIAFVTHAYHIGATQPGSREYQSVLSQLIGAVAGRGWFYYLSMASIFCVLALSANTSFAGFPRVCRLMALDQYLPEGFARRGRRLVYTYGIVLLAVFSFTLLCIFRGITDKLIPLFAIGALLAFTMSQSGMVAHWRQHSKEPHARIALWINGAGALATGITVLIVMVSKFIEGAWITILLVPIIMIALQRLKKHQRRLEAAVESHGPLDFCATDAPIMVVPLSGWTRVAEKALLFATRLSPEVHAVQVLTREVPEDDLSKHWDEFVEEPAREAGFTPPTLKVVHSQFRQELRPVVNYVRELVRENPGRTVGVVVPEVIERKWYHYFLSYATLLRGMLLLRGNPRIVIMTMPWYAPTGHHGAA
ncbi:MAG TPA: APC family permease [Verrucomicrobiae bacterium]|nr:APC family permease [Verrucomicrobiae bacterium]